MEAKTLNKYHLLAKRAKRQNQYDFSTKIAIYLISAFVTICLFAVIGFIIYKSVYFFQIYGIKNFLFGKTWNAGSSQYGVWLVIVMNFFILLLTLLIAAPLSIFSSLFITEYLSTRIKRKVIAVIQLLSGIPSVVFGLFALSILGPLFMALGAPSNANLIVTVITLAFMGLPIMVSLSINAIEAVPQSYRFGAVALGLSKEYVTFKIVLKTAFPKIVGAIMMGIARIVGETMAVLMICGNNTSGLQVHSGLAKFLYSSVATLASVIGLEILESVNNLHTSGLYAIGLVLFLLVSLINIFGLVLQNTKYRKKRRWRILFSQARKQNTLHIEEGHTIKKKSYRKLLKSNIAHKAKWRKVNSNILFSFMISSTAISVGFTLTILITILYRNIIGIRWEDFVSTSTFNQGTGILASFCSTLLLVICAIMIAVPLALCVALVMNEYAPANRFVKVLRFALNILSSTPSIIYGLFSLLFFIGILHIPISLLVGGITLTLVILPMLIRNIEDALSSVPSQVRQACYSLGASQNKTIFKLAVPHAAPGIAVGVVLAIARVIGESAPIYLTIGTAVFLPTSGFMSPGATMSVSILMLWKNGANSDAFRVMYELALAIMVIVLLLNWIVHAIEYRFLQNTQKKATENWFKKIKNYNYKQMFKRIKQLFMSPRD